MKIRFPNLVARKLLAIAGVAAVILAIPGARAFAQSEPSSAVPQARLLRETKGRWATRGIKTRMVRVHGVTLHVAEAGQGDAVLLLHGYPQTGEVWRFVAPELAKTHHIIIPDLRGMGLSEAAADGYDLGNVAEDLH